MPTGPAGSTGPTGPTGATGAAGTNGTDGTTNLFHIDTSANPTGTAGANFTGYTYTMPAATLAATGDAVEIQCSFNRANISVTPVVELYFGGTLIFTTSPNIFQSGITGASVSLKVRVVRTGATTVKTIIHVYYSSFTTPILATTVLAGPISNNLVVPNLTNNTTIINLFGTANPVTDTTATYMIIDLIK